MNEFRKEAVFGSFFKNQLLNSLLSLGVCLALWQCAKPPLAQESKLTGPQVIEAVAPLAPADRDAFVLEQLLKEGNGPDFLRHTKRVPLVALGPEGDTLRGYCYAILDYLAVGGDNNFVRMPLQPQSAQAVAQAWSCTLPTRKVVDAIYAAADLKLEPRPLTENRDSALTFLQHNQIIQQQLKGKHKGKLIAGHKKDVVLSPRLLNPENTDRVAIYGWHKKDGKPIQPLYLCHLASYTDYSHGIRLVLDRFEVNGQVYTMQQLLADPMYSRLVCDEEICEPVRY